MRLETHWGLLGSVVAPHRRALGLAAAALTLAAAIPLAGPLLLQHFIDGARSGASTASLVRLALIYGVLGLLGAGIEVAVSWRVSSLAWRVTNDLRQELTEHVLYADLAFHRDHTTGELINRIDADVTSVTQFVSRFVARAGQVVLTALGTLIVLAVVEPLLVPPFAVLVAYAGWLVWHKRDFVTDASQAERAAEAEVMSVVEEHLTGAEDLATLGAGRIAVRRLVARSEVLIQAVRHRTFRQMMFQRHLRLTIVFGELLMLLIGGLAFERGWITLGTVFLANRFVAVIGAPIEQLSWRMAELQGASGAARRVLELLAMARTSHPSGAAGAPTEALVLRFEGVGLVYDGVDDVLRDIDLDLPPGRVVGFVGRSGSGKTSLARLVLRLVHPTAGRITLGGLDLESFDEHAFRRLVSAVPQDVQLFPGTIRDNLSLFDPTVADDALVAAVHTVGLGDWFATQSSGLETELRSDGAMSAGEAQLLSLARVVVRDPKVLVLDEATSRIDPATQRQIAGATIALLRGRTALIVAHRLETLAVCDDIAVVEDGRIVEYGPRIALAAASGSRFAQLLEASEGVAP